jgi:hypothetical protein
MYQTAQPLLPVKLWRGLRTTTEQIPNSWWNDGRKSDITRLTGEELWGVFQHPQKEAIENESINKMYPFKPRVATLNLSRITKR